MTRSPMNKSTAIAVLILFLILIGAAFAYVNSQHYAAPAGTNGEQGTTTAQTGTYVPTPNAVTPAQTSPAPAPQPLPPGNTHASDTGAGPVELFVSNYVSHQLGGGSFTVDHVEAHGGAGTVYYHDSKRAYIADFTYSIDEFGSMSIDTFTIR